MRATIPLLLAGPDRTGRDRWELLSALISGPSFDPMFRAEIIRIPPDHPVYSWQCAVADCERPSWATDDLCTTHKQQWLKVKRDGGRRGVFLRSAQPLKLTESLESVVCRVCCHRPAFNQELALCH